MVKGFQQKQHESTETVDRYLQDGLEGIKRQEVKQALTAFETALKMDNETGLVWHHGAMLYFEGRYEEAVEQLDRAIAHFEETQEQPATEEKIWRAASLYRLLGPEQAQAHIHTHTHKFPSPYGEEKRILMGAVWRLFVGEVTVEQIEDLVLHTQTLSYTNYELYGHFYLGLYHDACGKRIDSLSSLERATKAPKGRHEDVMFHFPRMLLTLRARAL